MRTWMLSVVLAVCAVFTACSGSGGGTPPPPPPPSLTSITVAAAGGAAAPYTAFKTDAQITFVATGHYSDNSTQTLTSGITWSSSKPAIATIDTTGKVTYVAAGATTISATSGAISGTVTLTVVPQLTSITIATATPSIALQTTAQFTATGNFDDGTKQNFITVAAWSSDNLAVATISSSAGTSGLARGLTPGTANIHASYTQPGTTLTPSPSAVTSLPAALTVTPATLSSITLSPANPTIGIGTQHAITCTGHFSDGSNQDISNLVAWSTSASQFVTVAASSGIVTGAGLGSAMITATPGSWPGVTQASTLVTVDTSSVASIAILPGSPSIANKTTLQLRALATLNDGSTLYVTTVLGINWQSSAVTIASVTNYGYVQSLGTPSNATITAILGPATTQTTAMTNVTVTPATINSIAVTPGQVSIAPATSQRFVATGTFSDTTTQDITDVAQWTLVPASGVASFLDPQNPSVATGSALGSATIKADWNGAPTGSAKLNVTGATLSKITVTPDKSFIPPAGLLQYTATGTFSDNSTQTLLNVAWDSQFPSIASIDPFNGLATGNGAGTTTITAKLGSVQGQTSLLVTGSQLQSIAVTPANATIAEQTGLALTATGTFQDGTSRDITGSVHWSSSALAVATVGNSGNRQGIVLGLTPGQTNITAALNGVTGQTNLIVTAATLMSIDITPTAPTISLGQTQQLKATGHFSDGSMQDLTLFATWTTDTATVAVVDAAGLVTAAGKGSANITATMNGQSNHILITVQ